MSDAEQIDLINRYLEAYNAFDIDGMLATLSPGIRFENYSGDAMTASSTGVDEFRALAEHAKQIFAEREQRIVALDSRDGAVVATIDHTTFCRADGGFAGLEASYLRSETLDLAENASGEAEEWYIGIFGSIAF